MTRLEMIQRLRPFREFTLELKAAQLDHLNNDMFLYQGEFRYICSLLGVLHEQLFDRPDLQDLVLEATWMARRMNDQHGNKPQAELDWNVS